MTDGSKARVIEIFLKLGIDRERYLEVREDITAINMVERMSVFSGLSQKVSKKIAMINEELKMRQSQVRSLGSKVSRIELVEVQKQYESCEIMGRRSKSIWLDRKQKRSHILCQSKVNRQIKLKEEEIKKLDKKSLNKVVTPLYISLVTNLVLMGLIYLIGAFSAKILYN